MNLAFTEDVLQPPVFKLSIFLCYFGHCLFKYFLGYL